MISMNTTFEIMLTFYCMCSPTILFFIFLTVHDIYKKIDSFLENSSDDVNLVN